MKKKGFTLVELLAVIAILAILIIIAMPNILQMFNKTKISIFVTEVQKIIDVATTTYTNDTLFNNGETIYYSSENNIDLNTKELNLSDSNKNYFIEMDRHGNFKRIVVYDSNYCYDIYTNYGSNSIGSIDSNSKEIIDQIKKTSVVIDDVKDSGNDTIIPIILKDGTIITSYSGIGCNVETIINNAGEIIPDGGKYVDSNGDEYNQGETMPYPPKKSDVYTYGEYEYKYNNKINDSGNWIVDETMNGWGVKLIASSSLKSYTNIESEINNKPIISIDYLYEGCTNLEEPPLLPNSIKSMKHSFSMCIKALDFPYLPENVEDISYAFYGYGMAYSWVMLLPDGFKIPNKVKNMEGTFQKARLVYPPEEIPGSVINIKNAFRDSLLFEAPNLENLTSATQFNSVFENCDYLIDASNVVLPESAWNLNRMFADCERLKNPPDLSKAKGNNNGNLAMAQIFFNSPNLEGRIEINANYVFGSNEDFYSTTKTITLTGTCNNLAETYTLSNIKIQ